MEQNLAKKEQNDFGMSIHCAHFSSIITDQALCIGLTTDPQRNALCISSGCKSVLKSCPACLAQGELKRIGHRPETCCESGQKSCAFHINCGTSERRKKVEAERIVNAKTAFDISSMIIAIAKSEGQKKVYEPRELAAASNDSYILIKRSRIRRNPDQPRKRFSLTSLHDLASSIEEFGQKVPISVRPVFDDPDHDWELVNGERRYRACGMVGVEELKAVIDNPVDEKYQYLDSVIMNFNSEPHTALEIADAIQKIKDDFKFSDEKIGKSIFGGKTGVWVGGYLRLRKLHPEVKAMLDPDLPDEKRLNTSIAIYLASQEENQDRQLVIAKEIIEGKKKTSHAYAHIRDRAAPHQSEKRKASLKGKCRERKPSDDYCVVFAFIQRAEVDFKLHLSMGQGKIRKMFERRPYKDRESVSESLLNIINNAKKFRDMIEDMT